MKITSIRTTAVLAPLPRPLRTASGTIERFPMVLIDAEDLAAVRAARRALGDTLALMIDYN